MSRVDMDKLLTPVAEEMPCGEDLSELTDYYVLEELARGKEETQFSPAEPPDWPGVLNLAVTLLSQGKELWVVVHLIRSLLVLGGAKGLGEGMTLLAGMLMEFWDGIYPELDEDEGNPADQRMNILNNLSSRGSGFLDDLMSMPLCRSRQLGSFSFRDILLSRGELPPREEEEAPAPSMIEGAIRDSAPEFISETVNSLKEAVSAIQRLDEFLTARVGSNHNTSNITLLSDLIVKMTGEIHIGETAPSPVPEQDDGKKSGPDISAPPSLAPGREDEISSRKDVIAILDRIAAWYGMNEPSSPVPLIINRARDLVGKNFREVVRELADQAEEQITGLFGPDEGDASAPPMPPSESSSEPGIDGKGDVLKLLTRIYDWYLIFEPSSPVPLFIERARKLVGRNFMEIIDDIAGGPLEQVNALMGINLEND